MCAMAVMSSQETMASAHVISALKPAKSVAQAGMATRAMLRATVAEI